MTNQDQISKALTSLLQRSNDDAFVIFEDVKTKKYVQFAGSKNEQLLLDLPFIALTPDEIERAKKLFSEYNAKPVESPVSDYKDSPITSTSKQFVMKLGSDVKKATEITSRIFKEVYLLQSDFNLGKEEN